MGSGNVTPTRSLSVNNLLDPRSSPSHKTVVGRMGIGAGAVGAAQGGPVLIPARKMRSPSPIAPQLGAMKGGGKGGGGSRFKPLGRGKG